MRIIDLETINQAMDNETQFVLRCEEVFHDKVSSAAAAILSAGRDRRIVALTGPSGSGKTTTAMRLREYLENLGVKVCLLSMDNFFLPLDQRPPEATDWESPYCVNVEQLVGCIGRLLDGEEADIPWYDFKTGTKTNVSEQAQQQASKYTEANLISIRDNYRRNMELGWIITAAWYAIQIMDAAVDAHFFYFEVDDNLTMRVEPTWNPAFNSTASCFTSCNAGLSFIINF